MSHTHTQLMPRKNMLMAPVLIKRKCLFKMCCTKAGTPSCMMILSPRLSPVLGLLKRRKTSNRLRGRELPPGTIPRSDLHFTCNGYTGRIWCRYALSGSVLKGQFLPGSTEQRQEDRASRGESSENVHLRSSQFTGPPSETALPQRRGVVRYCGSPLPTTILFCVISKNSINNFFLTLGLPFLTPPSQSPTVDTVLVLSQTSDNNYIQICQLEKDKQKRVFCGVFRCCFFAYTLDSEAGKEHNVDHSRPFVCGFGWGEGFSVI